MANGRHPVTPVCQHRVQHHNAAVHHASSMLHWQTIQAAGHRFISAHLSSRAVARRRSLLRGWRRTASAKGATCQPCSSSREVPCRQAAMRLDLELAAPHARRRSAQKKNMLIITQFIRQAKRQRGCRSDERRYPAARSQAASCPVMSSATIDCVRLALCSQSRIQAVATTGRSPQQPVRGPRTG